MEKGDKIQHRQEQRKKYGLMAVVSVVCVFVVYLMSSDDFRQQQALRLQQVEHRVEDMVHKEADFLSQKAKVPLAVVSAETLDRLEATYKDLDGEVRAIKKTGVIMETDPTSLQKTKELQDAARALLKAKYGDHEAYRVRVDLEFPPTIPDFDTGGPSGSIVIEMAPIALIPVSVYTFLEVARTWVRGAFHRNANHVLQVQAVSSEVHQHLPFQEYSKEFPHQKGTTGYCGRPSGPCWYVSIMDNTMNHGPGSQQKKNQYEADANFGRIVEGFDDVVPRIHSIRQNGWLDEKNQIKIIKKTILIPDGNGGFTEWVDHTKGGASMTA